MQGTVTQPQCPKFAECRTIRCPVFYPTTLTSPKKIKCLLPPPALNRLKKMRASEGMFLSPTPTTRIEKFRIAQLHKYQRVKSDYQINEKTGVTTVTIPTYADARSVRIAGARMWRAKSELCQGCVESCKQMGCATVVKCPDYDPIEKEG